MPADNRYTIRLPDDLARDLHRFVGHVQLATGRRVHTPDLLRHWIRTGLIADARAVGLELGQEVDDAQGT